jgi:predicted RNA-binding Zn-ribbon protein involved in translation (DUF1610 family)
MTTADNEIKQKISSKFYCPDCDYGTSRKSNFDTHLLSNKHQSCVLTTNNNGIKQKLSKTYTCPNCDKDFNDRAGLWRHKNKCVLVEDKVCPSNEISQELILNIIQQNKELQQMLIEQNKQNQELQTKVLEICKNGIVTNNNTTNNTTNSHNKAFNLNFFLNETCKDAMNIMDFVDSIKLQLSDLEKVGELGYVEGISNIIVKNLNDLDVTQRPVHCTDKKRETMYIKDQDKWEKDENNSKIKKAIKRVASKNQRLLPKFKEAHPDCGTYHSKYSDQYNKIIIESVGGSGDNDAEKEEKIIRNISKNVIVEK